MNKATPTRKCERLSLTTETKRRLWSACGGYCQNPGCTTQQLFADGTDIDFAEMAHIISASSGGPRDGSAPEMAALERAHHTNVAVLCANCHTIVDKAPERYPASLMKQWKERQALALEMALGTPVFDDRAKARSYIAPKLDENRAIFNTYGPHRNDLTVEAAAQWRRHVLRTVIPNNADILRALKKNRKLLTEHERDTSDVFSIHKSEFEARHLLDDFTAGSTRFPEAINQILKDAE